LRLEAASTTVLQSSAFGENASSNGSSACFHIEEGDEADGRDMKVRVVRWCLAELKHASGLTKPPITKVNDSLLCLDNYSFAVDEVDRVERS